MYMYRSVFAGDVVYGRRHRHDVVDSKLNNVCCLGIIEDVFAHYFHGITANFRLLLIHVLEQVDPDSSNFAAVNKFGT